MNIEPIIINKPSKSSYEETQKENVYKVIYIDPSLEYLVLWNYEKININKSNILLETVSRTSSDISSTTILKFKYKNRDIILKGLYEDYGEMPVILDESNEVKIVPYRLVDTESDLPSAKELKIHDYTPRYIVDPDNKNRYLTDYIFYVRSVEKYYIFSKDDCSWIILSMSNNSHRLVSDLLSNGVGIGSYGVAFDLGEVKELTIELNGVYTRDELNILKK